MEKNLAFHQNTSCFKRTPCIEIKVFFRIEASLLLNVHQSRRDRLSFFYSLLNNSAMMACVLCWLHSVSSFTSCLILEKSQEIKKWWIFSHFSCGWNDFKSGEIKQWKWTHCASMVKAVAEHTQREKKRGIFFLVGWAPASSSSSHLGCFKPPFEARKSFLLSLFVCYFCHPMKARLS